MQYILVFFQNEEIFVQLDELLFNQFTSWCSASHNVVM